MIDWHPVLGVLYSPYESQDRLQHSHDPKMDKQLKKWMDGSYSGGDNYLKTLRISLVCSLTKK